MPGTFFVLLPAPQFQEYYDERQRLQELDGYGLAYEDVEPISGAWMALPAAERHATSRFPAPSLNRHGSCTCP